MSTASLTIYIDGAARGNPGPAAFAYVITGEEQTTIEASGCLGHTTNNVAEYTALVRALEHARQLGARQLRIHSDSELLVKQMNGLYRVKNPDLQVLCEKARELCERFDAVEIVHVRREQNREADRLCNEALDGAKSKAAPLPQRKRPSKGLSEGRVETVREDALACLRSAAVAWGQGRVNGPRVEEVWEQLWSILEEQGVLRE